MITFQNTRKKIVRCYHFARPRLTKNNLSCSAAKFDSKRFAYEVKLSRVDALLWDKKISVT